VRDFINEMRKQDISAYASSMAFFFFLSLVPMLIVICTVIPYTPLTQEHLIVFLTDITPDMMDSVVESLIAEVYDKSAGILSVAIVATIWSAGKAVLALMRGLNAIYDVEEKRNYFVVRSIASFYTLVMLIVVILSLVLVVFGNRLVALLLHKIPQLQGIVSILMNFRFVLVWGIIALLFALIYAYIPNCKLRFRNQITGAMFTSVMWSIFSWGFSMYVNRGGAFNIYGSLSIIVIFLLWLYFCFYIIFIGAYINKRMGEG
jgi:membrane protein